MQAHGSNANRDTCYDGTIMEPSEAVQLKTSDPFFKGQAQEIIHASDYDTYLPGVIG